MKKFFLMFLLTALCSICAFAQPETPKSAEWTTFAPTDEEFSIEVPIPLNSTKTPILTSPGLRDSLGEKGKINESRRYLNSLNGTYLYIFSDYWNNPSQYRYVLDFAYDSNQLETTQNSGELTTKKFEFFDNMDFYHIILIVNGKNRVYVFQTVSPTKDNPVVERFFSSIKFNQKSLSESSSVSKTEKNITVTIPTSETVPTVAPQVSVKTSGSGAGLGDGSGIGLGGGSQNVPPNKTSTTTPDKPTAGVKVLSKPRANYTNFARFYEISGKVTLRVTFSANGTIGAISPVLKLPFGLTEEAIAAARGITFEPAIRNGVAYSVSKPVEYSFTIY